MIANFCFQVFIFIFLEPLINPLLPSVPYKVRLAKYLISISEGIIKFISYERRDYESVDEKSLSSTMSRYTQKNNSGSKGLPGPLNWDSDQTPQLTKTP